MRDIKFDGYKLEIKLVAQTPIIHFQYNQTGATLRATEVKPKLDKFLIKQLMLKNNWSSEDDVKKAFGEYFISSDKNALDYKLSFCVGEKVYKVDNTKSDKSSNKMENENKSSEGNNIIDLSGYNIYYGNMHAYSENNKENNEKKGILANTTLTIICFNEKIRKLIEENLLNFFIVTNFGTMQNKGFGGFLPDGYYTNGLLSDNQVADIAKVMKNTTGNPVYTIQYSNREINDKKAFKIIKEYYSILKSGRNHEGYIKSYIFRYMINKKIGNEKAYIKKKGIAPAIGKKPANDNNYSDWRYVRAMLGLCENLRYKASVTGRSYESIEISYKPKSKTEPDKIERMNSPIYFKIIGNYIFIMTYNLPDEIYDKTFEFSSDGKEPKQLKTPGKDEFDLNDLMDKYMVEYNKESHEINKNI